MENGHKLLAEESDTRHVLLDSASIDQNIDQMSLTSLEVISSAVHMGGETKMNGGPEGLRIQRDVSPVTTDVGYENLEGYLVVGRKFGILALGHAERKNPSKKLHGKSVDGRHSECRATWNCGGY